MSQKAFKLALVGSSTAVGSKASYQQEVPRRFCSMKISVFLFAFFALGIMLVSPSYGANVLSDGHVKREVPAAREPVLSRFARTVGNRGQYYHVYGGMMTFIHEQKLTIK
eukprot:GFUD01046639.1.p1 GENE.GFUD01046639.1~~GFUD01046639.1.p1  ORF type:complete len:110 (-),score=9.26 GFUD01046639.1:77-406(-)